MREPRAGTVWINNPLTDNHAGPFGGCARYPFNSFAVTSSSTRGGMEVHAPGGMRARCVEQYTCSTAAGTRASSSPALINKIQIAGLCQLPETARHVRQIAAKLLSELEGLIGRMLTSARILARRGLVTTLATILPDDRAG